MPSHAKPSATRKERKTMETEAWAGPFGSDTKKKEEQ
jgi:hypothetical protein